MGAQPKANPLDLLFTVLLIVGGINWGLVGILETDLVAEIFGNFSTLSRIVYALVGVSAVYVAARTFLGTKSR